MRCQKLLPAQIVAAWMVSEVTSDATSIFSASNMRSATGKYFYRVNSLPSTLAFDLKEGTISGPSFPGGGGEPEPGQSTQP